MRISEDCFIHAQFLRLFVHLLQKFIDESVSRVVTADIYRFNLRVVLAFRFHRLIKEQQSEYLSNEVGCIIT